MAALALYRSILRSALKFSSNVQGGRTIGHAHRLDLMGECSIEYDAALYVFEKQTLELVVSATRKDIIRQIRDQFQPEKVSDDVLDYGFSVLRFFSNHNAWIERFNCFEPKIRGSNVFFRVADVVELKDQSRGIIVGWEVSPDGPVYTILQGKTRRTVSQSEIERRATENEIYYNSKLCVYFKGFADGYFQPCEALEMKYPEDFVHRSKRKSIRTPTIVEIQKASQDQLLEYLHCTDATMIQLAKVSLETMWEKECGDGMWEKLQQVSRLLIQSKADEALKLVSELIKAEPQWAAAYEKQGLIYLEKNQIEEAHASFYKVNQLNPKHLGGLSGLASVALRLNAFPVAFSAATDLVTLHPTSSLAKRIFDKVNESI